MHDRRYHSRVIRPKLVRVRKSRHLRGIIYRTLLAKVELLE
jgi:hypothetical protein